MRLAIFNEFVNIKMLVVAETSFVSIIVMLKRFKAVKRNLQDMVISEQWDCFRADDIQKAQFVKEKVLNDVWWDIIQDISHPLSPFMRCYELPK